MIEVSSAAGVFNGIIKILMSFVALFTADPMSQANGALPLRLVATSEALDFEAPIQMEIIEGSAGDQQVLGSFPAPDAARFADFTRRHIGEAVVFEVCGVAIMAPVIREHISGGQFLISGAEQSATVVGFLKGGCP